MMKKKIRFSLKMENGVEVRSIEELKENFSLPKILLYIENGKLSTWLKDRYCDDIADAIDRLDKNDSEYHKKICDIFDVEYDASDEEDIEKKAERNRKLAKLKQYTDNKQYLDNVDFIAFEQDDIYDLLDNGVTTIYLCGDRFFIPLGKLGISYTGINNPTVTINSKTVVDWSEKNITLNGVKYDEKYQAVVDEENNSSNNKSYGSYEESYINFLLSKQDKEASKKTYEMLSKEICGLSYDIDRDIKNLREILSKEMYGLNYDIDRDIKDLRDSLLIIGIPGMAKSFLNSL